MSKESATLDGYNSITIHANHRDMVRFKSQDDIQEAPWELVR